MSEITTFGGQTAIREPKREADEAVEALLARVGERVRKARELKGLPRRVISESSGVSMRYLAQLEAGEGNISIGLLKRVALALDMPLEWLLAEEDPWDSGCCKIFRGLQDRHGRDAARGAGGTEPDAAREPAVEPGLPGGAARCRQVDAGGAGGQALGVPFLELNREIEDHSGMPVTELMALYGQTDIAGWRPRRSSG
ncbi:MAG: helix-turn-helix domain-containing protein [Paracoccaceae bacterium]